MNEADRAGRAAETERRVSTPDAQIDWRYAPAGTTLALLSIDATAVPALFAELEALTVGAGDRAREFREAVLDALQRGKNVVTLEGYRRSTHGASEFIVRFQPAEWLERAVAAARADNFDKRVIERALGHPIDSDAAANHSNLGGSMSAIGISLPAVSP